MAKEYDISLAFDKLKDEVLDIVKDETIAFHNKLIDVGEKVRDTGNFKNSFLPIQRVSRYKFHIHNSAPYASILARGRVNVNGRAYGSLKWQHGLSPMMKKLETKIKKRVDDVKY